MGALLIILGLHKYSLHDIQNDLKIFIKLTEKGIAEKELIGGLIGPL